MDRYIKLKIPIALLVLVCASCQCDDSQQQPMGPTICKDKDGDGFGPGCERGPDCDDSDRYLNVSCDCTAGHPGCPCDPGAEPITCYDGPAGTAGIGVCRSGTSSCQESSGRFGPCQGQVIPLGHEICNGQDDNCNDQVDEGVISACGDCNPNCSGVTVGPNSGTPFTPPSEENSSGVILDDDGNIVMDPDVSEESFHYLYVANSTEGTVSKIDAISLTEVGRYTSALNVSGVATGRDARASRTAVDQFGDCWVANRAHQDNNRQGSVTKIAAGGCTDKNSNGTVETSQDLDGDGVISTDPGFVDPTGQGRLEYYGDADECVLFTVPVGGTNAIPRAIALTGGSELFPSGLVFVGTHAERRFYVLDGRDGSLAAIANNPIDIDLRPYGAVIDSQGNIYATQQATDQLQAIRMGPNGLIKSQLFVHNDVAATIIGSYGIAVDGQDRIWTGGYAGDPASAPNSGTGVYRFTPGAADANGLPTDGTWSWVDPGAGTVCEGSHSRGVTVHNDADGKSWVWASITSGCVAVIDAETMAINSLLDPPGNHQFIGVGPDFVIDSRTGVSHIWAVSFKGNGSDTDVGEAVRITYDYASSNAVAYDTVPVGRNPYTYSDFTGYGLRSFTTRTGTYLLIVPGCPNANTQWARIIWQANVPDMTQVCVRGISLDTADLTAPGTGASNPVCQRAPGGQGEADISGLPASPYLLIETTLTRLAPSVTDSPAISALGAAFTCPGSGG